jgi:hypothetical protein
VIDGKRDPDDDRRAPVAEQLVHRLPRAPGPGPRAEHQLVAVLGRHRVDRLDQVRLGGADGREGDADVPRLGLPQRARRQVRLVAQFLGDLLHPLPGFTARPGQSAQGDRNQLTGNAEPGGDVGHRGLAHTISCRRPRGHRAADPADFTPAVRCKGRDLPGWRECVPATLRSDNAGDIAAGQRHYTNGGSKTAA